MSIWTTIVTAAFTLAGALGGVYLTQRHVVQEAERARTEQRRDHLREILAELLTDGGEFVDAGQVLVAAYGRMSTNDLNEFMETDSGKAMRTRSRALRYNLAQLRLLVQDEPLAGALELFNVCVRDYAEKANGPVLEAQRNGGDVIPAISVGLRHVSATASALAEVDDRATEFLRVSLSPVGGSSWWRRPRPSA